MRKVELFWTRSLVYESDWLSMARWEREGRLYTEIVMGGECDYKTEREFESEEAIQAFLESEQACKKLARRRA